uniref:Serine aminopeptidase S33 domain-containing protein n=1 Tax=Globisporangium ultimum (strain ATCC 200006 / CBS 805.95 / DAOM BR144) TaxID=431595 RepID=K3XCJ1_GLOUD
MRVAIHHHLVTYTRSGNDSTLEFNTFNFIGRIKDLQAVLEYAQSVYPGSPIHAVGASAGSALLIRYLGKYNKKKIIKSAMLILPGCNLV